MRNTVLLLVVLVVLAGCAAPAEPGAGGGPDAPPGYDEDPIGWENGYWYDDDLSVTPGDGLNESEREAVAARTMARVERIRGLEFTRTVPVEVVSREQFERSNTFRRNYGTVDEQLWEATFVVGEDQTVEDAFAPVYGGSVAGFYSLGQITIVSEDPDAPQVSRSTLAHELVHALQGQQLSLARSGATRDARLASTSVVEGDANYVMDRYEERCGEAWDCLPPTERASGDRSFNRGLFVSLFAPYSEGPALVGHLRERGGWDAVDALYDDHPASTEQVIHPERYPDETPVDVTVPDRSDGDWERRDRTETVGEATLFAALWHNGVVPEEHLRSDDVRYNYSHPVTDGWAGDTLAAYTNGDEGAYVWKLAWDSPGEAREFHDAYRELLDTNEATEVRDGVYRIPEGSGFGDALRVSLDGDTVTVVNAPTVDALDDVHGPA